MEQHALHRLPDAWLGECIWSVDDEVAAVGAEDRASFDASEVGAPVAALVGDALDRSEQVDEGRRRLDDDRTSFGLRVVEDDIDAIDPERIVLLPVLFRPLVAVIGAVAPLLEDI